MTEAVRKPEGERISLPRMVACCRLVGHPETGLSRLAATGRLLPSEPHRRFAAVNSCLQFRLCGIGA